MKSYFVNSFTTEMFKGNPAGVCFPSSLLSDDLMLSIAKEFGFSETAFVQQLEVPGTYSIRFFSPKKEIPLCGHATLASAKVMFNELNVDEIIFITSERVRLFVRRNGEKILMEFPVYDTVPSEVPTETLAALGIAKVLNVVFSEKNKIKLIEIEDSNELAALRPAYDLLVKSHSDVNGVLVTARSRGIEFDYHYRYFWPWAGTNEDPVTGAVQTFLAKYWSVRLGKSVMRAFQSSERTGTMDVILEDRKVTICGHAIVIMEGEFALPEGK
jgi:PhzF family phenazine biosynthesis protein